MPKKCKLESSWSEELSDAIRSRWGIDIDEIIRNSISDEMKQKIDEELKKMKDSQNNELKIPL